MSCLAIYRVMRGFRNYCEHALHRARGCNDRGMVKSEFQFSGDTFRIKAYFPPHFRGFAIFKDLQERVTQAAPQPKSLCLSPPMIPDEYEKPWQRCHCRSVQTRDPTK